MDNEVIELPQDRIALIIDGEVAKILYVSEMLAAIFTSNPLIVNVTGMTSDVGGIVENGALYDYPTKTFTPRSESN